MSEEPAFLVVGLIARAHGTRGELYVESMTDHPGDVFVSGVVLLPGGSDPGTPDPDLPPLRVDAVRPFQRGWLVCFSGLEDRNAAEALRGRYLLVERDHLPPLAPGEVFLHQMVGMEVVTVDGVHVGEVSEVFEVGPTPLIEVRRVQRSVLIPFLQPTVREVDVAARRILIDPPEGLLDL